MVEWEEGRGLARGNPASMPQADRTLCRVQDKPEGLHQALERIRQAVRRDEGLKFTSLWHHVYKVDPTPRGIRGTGVFTRHLGRIT